MISIKINTSILHSPPGNIECGFINWNIHEIIPIDLGEIMVCIYLKHHTIDWGVDATVWYSYSSLSKEIRSNVMWYLNNANRRIDFIRVCRALTTFIDGKYHLHLNYIKSLKRQAKANINSIEPFSDDPFIPPYGLFIKILQEHCIFIPDICDEYQFHPPPQSFHNDTDDEDNE